MVVRVFEDVVSKRIHAFIRATILAFDLRNAIRVMVVEAVDTAICGFEQYGVGGLRSLCRFDIDGCRPCLTAIGAAQRNNVLPRCAFIARARGDDAEPGVVIGLHNIGLIRIVLAGDEPAIRQVACIGYRARRCGCGKKRKGLKRRDDA